MCNRNSEERFAGVDVAKAHLDLALGPTGEVHSFLNNDEGVSALTERLAGWQPTLVVMEATGVIWWSGDAAGGLGTRRGATLGGGAAGTELCQSQRRAGENRSVGRPSAGAVCPGGASGGSTRPHAEEQEFAELLARRQQLVAMRAQERTRLAMTSSRQREGLHEHIAWLSERIARLDVELSQRARASDSWQTQIDLLHSAPGVGPVTGLVLLSYLPELGRLNRREIAAIGRLGAVQSR